MANNISQLVNSLKDSSIYPHSVQSIDVIETHISWVILTGPFAYKIKKPVNLGFLDFTTLEKRHHYCLQELKLNRRLSPDYYLDVIAIVGSDNSPKLIPETDKEYNQSDVIEYAVKMKQFPQSTQLDRLLGSGKLANSQIDKLAQKIAEFHDNTKVINAELESKSKSRAKSNSDIDFGSAEQVLKNALDCYDHTLSLITDENDRERVNSLRRWTCNAFDKLHDIFVARKNSGFIRECHGDLHCRNIAIVDDDIVIFDGIEFSDALLWNDVMSEIAFLTMDLDDHGQTKVGFRFLNRYLEITGDYQGIATLRYYQVYRAMVRCMVSSIRLTQPGLDNNQYSEELSNFREYLLLAEGYTKRTDNKLIVTHGYSGSGKTTISEEFLQYLPAIRIRSDIERKRLLGLSETTRPDDELQKIYYGNTVNEQIYQHLSKLARLLLKSGYHVIVDAAFLEKKRRDSFCKLAQKSGKKFIILDFLADIDTLKTRLIKRKTLDRDASDADVDVLQKQLDHTTGLESDERNYIISIDTRQKLNIDSLCQEITKF